MGHKFITGHNTDKSIHEGHSTMDEAVAWIDAREKTDPDGVANGDYYIDDMRIES